MSNDLKFYINGEWVQSDSNELIDVINPANEEVIGQVTAGTKKDIDDAKQIKKTDFETLNLEGILSANRRNGLSSLISTLQTKVSAL